MVSTECLFCRKVAAIAELPAAELIWQFPHSLALLGPWQYYQGYCILVTRRHATELHHLSDSERRAYLDEMSLLASVIADCFQPAKMNYELLGNQVGHLHWHLFPRYADDPDRLQPVWLTLQRAEHDDRERQRLQAGSLERTAITGRLRQALDARSS